MREFLSGAYETSRFEVVENVEGFFAQANRFQLSRLRLFFVAFASGVEADFQPANRYRQHFCLNGRGENFMRGASFPLSREDSALIAPDVENTARLEPGFQSLILCIDPDALGRKLESLLGHRVNRAIEFTARITFRDPAAQNLKRSVLFLAHELDATDSELSELALKEYEDYLLLLFLTANSHNYSDVLRRPEKEGGPWQVKLTEDYLAANWNKAVTVEEIARTAGVTARSIFKSFKKSRGYSPMTFLKEMRLKKAQDLLRQAEIGVTVASIADQCGFLSHGHFSRDYHSHFGEYPSATLRRAQGRG